MLSAFHMQQFLQKNTDKVNPWSMVKAEWDPERRQPARKLAKGLVGECSLSGMRGTINQSDPIGSLNAR